MTFIEHSTQQYQNTQSLKVHIKQITKTIHIRGKKIPQILTNLKGQISYRVFSWTIMELN